ncbi:MAG: hypothetical protein WAT20_02640 [Ferruginibacter sp.]|nr:hypothetical protein [Chitinophagaceae bacterium]
MTRKQQIEAYEKCLKTKLDHVKNQLNGLKSQMITESYYGDTLNDPTAGGLSAFLGKAKLSMDLLDKHIPEVTSEIENCGLKSVDFYKTTSPVLRKLARQLDDDANHYKDLESKARKPDMKRQRKVEWYFSLLYKNIVKEIFIDSMQTEYTKRRGDTKKTTCGEPCKKDGHPCQHIVWEGWVCWQHGGGKKGI